MKAVRVGYVRELVAKGQVGVLRSDDVRGLVPLPPLDRDTLKTIMMDNVVQKHRFEFASEGLELDVSEEVLEHIVDKALERQTGARGLNSLLSQFIEEAAFDYFDFRVGKVILELKDGKVRSTFVD